MNSTLAGNRTLI